MKRLWREIDEMRLRISDDGFLKISLVVYQGAYRNIFIKLQRPSSCCPFPPDLRDMWYVMDPYNEHKKDLREIGR